jgi:hypothetical protein
MSEDHIDVAIGDHASDRGGGGIPMDDSTSETQRTRAAFANRNLALNEMREARIDRAAAHLNQIETQAAAEQAAAARALEVGDWNDHAARQCKISELAVERGRVEDDKRYWENQPQVPADPVDAFIASRANEPGTQAWLRAHPSDALALATGHDPRRVAKLNAAHNDALAEGHASSDRCRRIFAQAQRNEKPAGLVR